MGGWYLDVIIAFVFRMCAQWLRRIRSRKWPTTTAIVFQSYGERTGLGCEVRTVSYDYVVGREQYSATHDEPFLFGSPSWFTQDYVRGKEITVRYKPDDPSRSVALI